MKSQGMDWKKLKELKCPMQGCEGDILPEKFAPLHYCNRCSFRIGLEKLARIIIPPKDRFTLEPPQFIKDLHAKSA